MPNHRHQFPQERSIIQGKNMRKQFLGLSFKMDFWASLQFERKCFDFKRLNVEYQKLKSWRTQCMKVFVINTSDWKECMWTSEHFSCWRGSLRILPFWGEEKRTGRQDSSIPLSFFERVSLRGSCALTPKWSWGTVLKIRDVRGFKPCIDLGFWQQAGCVSSI